jgi:hypothetical protein
MATSAHFHFFTNNIELDAVIFTTRCKIQAK